MTRLEQAADFLRGKIKLFGYQTIEDKIVDTLCPYEESCNDQNGEYGNIAACEACWGKEVQE